MVLDLGKLLALALGGQRFQDPGMQKGLERWLGQGPVPILPESVLWLYGGVLRRARMDERAIGLSRVHLSGATGL